MKENKWKESKITRLIQQGDERSYSGRKERLKILLSIEPQESFPVPALAYEYYEEARLCWYVGAFVATIVMTQLSFEELFRSHYRVAKGVNGKLNCGKRVEDAGFRELIEEAKNDGWISKEEAELLHNLRRNVRNPYVHVKDIKTKDNGKIDTTVPNFFTQYLKIVAPEIVGSSVEKESREAISLLVTLFPVVSRRVGGI